MLWVLIPCIKPSGRASEAYPLPSHHPTPSQDVADLIGQCLRSDPRQRPTATEVLRRLRDSNAAAVDSSESGG